MRGATTAARAVEFDPVVDLAGGLECLYPARLPVNHLNHIVSVGDDRAFLLLLGASLAPRLRFNREVTACLNRPPNDSLRASVAKFLREAFQRTL